MRFQLFIIVFISGLISCSSSPEEMIIGTWKFKTMHVDQTIIGTYGQEYIDQLDSSMSTVVMIFGEDGSYTSKFTDQPGEVTGTYSSNGDGTFTIRAMNTGVAEQATVTRLEEDEMVVQTQGWAYLMVR
jgi:hypothetical protein